MQTYKQCLKNVCKTISNGSTVNQNSLQISFLSGSTEVSTQIKLYKSFKQWPKGFSDPTFGLVFIKLDSSYNLKYNKHIHIDASQKHTRRNYGIKEKNRKLEGKRKIKTFSFTVSTPFEIRCCFRDKLELESTSTTSCCFHSNWEVITIMSSRKTSNMGRGIISNHRQNLHNTCIWIK